jgi:hypothetical protein
VLVTLLMLVLLVVPSVLLGNSLVSGATKVVGYFQSGNLSVPPPPDSVARWPLIGEPVARARTLASDRPPRLILSPSRLSIRNGPLARSERQRPLR